MSQPIHRHSRARTALVAGATAMLCALAAPLSVQAGSTAMQPDHGKHHVSQGSAVLPATARPYGYSLADMARLTAVFNVGDRSGPPPNSPFQILYYNGVTGATSFTVAPGTFLYLPLLYNDNSIPVIGNMPSNVEDRHKALRYWFSQSEFGVVQMDIVIDGKVTALKAGHVAGVSFQSPLPDGATQYLTAAAFIAPLPRGNHTVEIRFKATGDALRVSPISDYFPDGFWEFSLSYSVTVK